MAAGSARSSRPMGSRERAQDSRRRRPVVQCLRGGRLFGGRGDPALRHRLDLLLEGTGLSDGIGPGGFGRGHCRGTSVAEAVRWCVAAGGNRGRRCGSCSGPSCRENGRGSRQREGLCRGACGDRRCSDRPRRRGIEPGRGPMVDCVTGVKVGASGSHRLRACTHLDVDREQVLEAAAIIGRCVEAGVGDLVGSATGPYSRG